MSKEIWIAAYDEVLDRMGLDSLEGLSEDETESFYTKVEERAVEQTALLIDRVMGD